MAKVLNIDIIDNRLGYDSTTGFPDPDNRNKYTLSVAFDDSVVDVFAPPPPPIETTGLGAFDAAFVECTDEDGTLSPDNRLTNDRYYTKKYTPTDNTLKYLRIPLNFIRTTAGSAASSATPNGNPDQTDLIQFQTTVGSDLGIAKLKIGSTEVDLKTDVGGFASTSDFSLKSNNTDSGVYMVLTLGTRSVGDVNNDGTVTVADIVFLASVLADIDEQVTQSEQDPDYETYANIDGSKNSDGSNSIGVSDIVFLASALAAVPGYEL